LATTLHTHFDSDFGLIGIFANANDDDAVQERFGLLLERIEVDKVFCGDLNDATAKSGDDNRSVIGKRPRVPDHLGSVGICVEATEFVDFVRLSQPFAFALELGSKPLDDEFHERPLDSKIDLAIVPQAECSAPTGEKHMARLAKNVVQEREAFVLSLLKSEPTLSNSKINERLKTTHGCNMRNARLTALRSPNASDKGVNVSGGNNSTDGLASDSHGPSGVGGFHANVIELTVEPAQGTGSSSFG
jgi:hypothetical protein